ncbi:hypothetical protein R3P38DRAFT_1952012 [Favolaschia claudopus]|uniref:Uncharacterized protein n=1 Tax=Favolaschia claudopus TaxID=2862362 RepID=A0AAW0A1A7_9AGAR
MTSGGRLAVDADPGEAHERVYIRSRWWRSVGAWGGRGGCCRMGEPCAMSSSRPSSFVIRYLGLGRTGMSAAERITMDPINLLWSSIRVGGLRRGTGGVARHRILASSHPSSSSLKVLSSSSRGCVFAPSSRPSLSRPRHPFRRRASTSSTPLLEVAACTHDTLLDYAFAAIDRLYTPHERRHRPSSTFRLKPQPVGWECRATLPRCQRKRRRLEEDLMCQ